MDIIAIQLDTVWEDREANFRRIEGLLATIRIASRALVVLPEMFASGFSMNVARVAEAHDGPTAAFVRNLARKYQVWIVAGVATQADEGRAYNEALAIDPAGNELPRYRKMHPFTLADEHLHYAAGEQVVIHEMDGVKVAPFICYDLRFPEVFRSAALAGAEIFTVLANWPVARIDHWRTLLSARAIENQAAVVGVNRVGVDPHVAYSGQSTVIDPTGTFLAKATDTPQILQYTIDVATLRAYRKKFPALRDARSQGLPR